jgi:hypothetical protein
MRRPTADVMNTKRSALANNRLNERGGYYLRTVSYKQFALHDWFSGFDICFAIAIGSVVWGYMPAKMHGAARWSRYKL